MSIKLTKNQLRDEKLRLSQLQTYLPTLKLKKALLQIEVQNVLSLVEKLERQYELDFEVLSISEELIGQPFYFGDLKKIIKIQSVDKHYENIAGAEVPVLDDVIFSDVSYSLTDTPVWLDPLVKLVKIFIISKLRLQVAIEKKHILEKEFRQVNVRVNLFEKKLIPECQRIIRKITVFFGDRHMMEIGQIKMAKDKVIKRARSLNAH
ncbi:MAG: V-type ATP synthase subunit D [Victivallaceae bacterium]